VGQHSSASGSALLGLDGFEVLAPQVATGEWQLEVETTATVVGCQGCGMRAELHGRRTVRVRDLPIGGRPVVLAWLGPATSRPAGTTGKHQELLTGSFPLDGAVPYQKVKRVGHGFRNFANYRLRLLLHCGVTWQTHQTARLRGHSPRLAA
jgi:hypothetical protein